MVAAVQLPLWSFALTAWLCLVAYLALDGALARRRRRRRREQIRRWRALERLVEGDDAQW